MADPKSLKERVEEAQALLSNAHAGPYEVMRMPEDDTPTIFIGTPQDWQADVIPRLFSGGEATHCHRREEQWSITDLLAAAPDLVALVTELWTAYMAACDRADGRDRLEMEVKQLSEKHRAEGEHTQLVHRLLNSAGVPHFERGDDVSLAGSPLLKRVDLLVKLLREAKDGYTSLETAEQSDAVVRKEMGVRLGLQSADDSPSCLADFEDAIIEARAERDAALIHAKQLGSALSTVLDTFYLPGHIGEPGESQRSQSVRVTELEAWRKLLEMPDSGRSKT